MVAGMVAGMRTLLVFEVEIDEGKRPSTRIRRLDQLVRTAGGFIARMSHVTALRSVAVCDPARAEELSPELRYDGSQVAPADDELPVGLVG